MKQILCVVVILVVVAAGQTTSRQQSSPATSQAQIGRFQIIFNPNIRADTFLLDTQTGRIWSTVQYTDVKGTPSVWMYQERIDDESQFTVWLSHQHLITK